jgi:phage terminase small subunit
MSNKPLTPKQLRFVECYVGNATQACRDAGYVGTEGSLGVTANRLLKNAKIIKLIKEKENKILKPLIATRNDRMKFLSEVMADKKQSMKDRLKAVELLGKANGDFIDRVQNTHTFSDEDSFKDEDILEALKD